MMIRRPCVAAVAERAAQKSPSGNMASQLNVTARASLAQRPGRSLPSCRTLVTKASNQRKEAESSGTALHAREGASRRSLLLGTGMLVTGAFNEPLRAFANGSPPEAAETSPPPPPPSTTSPKATAATGTKSTGAAEAPREPAAAAGSSGAPGATADSAGKKKTPEELDVEADRILQEEEQAKKKKKRSKFEELAGVREDLRKKQVVILEREAELLDAEQTVAVLREELQLERSLRVLLTKEKEKAEEMAKLALGFCGQGYLMP